ncbi:hypothetical protein Tco_0701289 [Tanacetum coccineum]
MELYSKGESSEFNRCSPSPKRNMVPKAVLMRHMIGNMSYLTDFEEIDGGYVAFGGNPKGGKIRGRVSTHFDVDIDMFGVHNLVGDEMVVKSKVVVKATSTIPVSAATTTTTVITNDEINLAKALVELKSAKLPTTIADITITAVSTRPRAKGLVIHEQLQAEEEKEERVGWPAREKLNQIKTKRAEEKRNIPPTRALQRSFMCTYLKNMEGWKPKDLKNKSFVNIQQLFDKAMIGEFPLLTYRMSWFEEFQGKLKRVSIERGSKRAGTELEQGKYLRSKSIYAPALLTTREDLKTLWKLVKAKHGSTRPEEGYERVLWGDLKTMFVPHVEDQHPPVINEAFQWRTEILKEYISLGEDCWIKCFMMNLKYCLISYVLVFLFISLLLAGA